MTLTLHGRVRHLAAAVFLISQAASAQGASGLSGVWRSEGYGLVFALSDTLMQEYEISAGGCLFAQSFKPVARTGPGIEAAYGANGRVALIMTGSGADSKRLQGEGAASYISLRRVAEFPRNCRDGVPNTPMGVFDVFSATWAEHYILFDEHHAIWPATVAAARARVSPTMSQDSLFDLLAGMIEPFHNAHTFVAAPALKRSTRTLREGTDRVMKHPGAEFRSKDLPTLFAAADQKYLKSPLREFCNGMVLFGNLDDSTGYLRILGESGYTKQGDFASGLVALEASLDTIFSDRRMSGLVIDVRINFGGADPYGLALASRLTDREYLAYSKEARADPSDRTRWTPGQPSMVRPSTRPSFRGAVAELIGPVTISAGETTTQALMGRTPHVIRIGENTQGVFSDVLVRTLPNGWRFGLPNEVFRTADGRIFDITGIPPDIAVPVFADADVAAGRDPALDRALAELRKR
jgi:hypothetical protein